MRQLAAFQPKLPGSFVHLCAVMCAAAKALPVPCGNAGWQCALMSPSVLLVGPNTRTLCAARGDPHLQTDDEFGRDDDKCIMT